MIFRKCPKCELNYLKEGEKFCAVCSGKMKNISYVDDDELEICPNCGEREVVRGEEYCAECLAELSKGMDVSSKSAINDEHEHPTVLKSIADVEMEDIDVPPFELPRIGGDEDDNALDELKDEDDQDDDEEDDLYDEDEDLDDDDL